MSERNSPKHLTRFRRLSGLPTTLVAIGLWLACAVSAHADGQLWLLASVTRSLTPDWRVSVDFAPRWERDISDYSRNVLRLQVARALGAKVAVVGGYEYTDSRSVVTRDEHRVWEQVQVQQRVGSWTLSHRGRLEQRWLHLAPSVVVRTRYQFRASHPIAGSRRWSWQVLDEVLYTVRGTRFGPEQGFDRHRLGGGVAHALIDASHRRRRVHVAVHQPPHPLTNQHDHFAVFTFLARY